MYQLFETTEEAAANFALQCFGSDGEICNSCPFEMDCDGTTMRLGSIVNIKERMIGWLEKEVKHGFEAS